MPGKSDGGKSHRGGHLPRPHGFRSACLCHPVTGSLPFLSQVEPTARECGRAVARPKRIRSGGVACDVVEEPEGARGLGACAPRPLPVSEEVGQVGLHLVGGELVGGAPVTRESSDRAVAGKWRCCAGICRASNPFWNSRLATAAPQSWAARPHPDRLASSWARCSHSSTHNFPQPVRGVDPPAFELVKCQRIGDEPSARHSTSRRSRLARAI